MMQNELGCESQGFEVEILQYFHGTERSNHFILFNTFVGRSTNPCIEVRRGRDWWLNYVIISNSSVRFLIIVLECTFQVQQSSTSYLSVKSSIFKYRNANKNKHGVPRSQKLVTTSWPLCAQITMKYPCAKWDWSSHNEILWTNRERVIPNRFDGEIKKTGQCPLGWGITDLNH